MFKRESRIGDIVLGLLLGLVIGQNNPSAPGWFWGGVLALIVVLILVDTYSIWVKTRMISSSSSAFGAIKGLADSIPRPGSKKEFRHTLTGEKATPDVEMRAKRLFDEEIGANWAEIPESEHERWYRMIEEKDIADALKNTAAGVSGKVVTEDERKEEMRSEGLKAVREGEEFEVDNPSLTSDELEEPPLEDRATTSTSAEPLDQEGEGFDTLPQGLAQAALGSALNTGDIAKWEFTASDMRLKVTYTDGETDSIEVTINDTSV